MPEQSSFIKLSELLRKVDDTIRGTLGDSSWWIVAEIKERNDRGDYLYFELVEKAEGGNDLVAKARASVWRREAIAAFRNFEDITGKKASSGMQVLVRAGVSFHPVHGFALQLFDIDSQYELGRMELLRRETILQLSRQKDISLTDGVFQTPNKREDLPPVIHHIAVITSASAAGYQDFVHTIRNNPFRYRFHIRPYLTIVQGDKAADAMREKLLEVFRDKENGTPVDVVVMIRGGGAQSDLLPFDNFKLAHAVARFPVPVITGIGHHKNESVTDMVAHTSVKTPTQAAEFIIDHNRCFEEKLEGIRELIALRSQNLLTVLQRRTEHLAVRISNGAIALLHTRQMYLERVKEKMKSGVAERVLREQSMLKHTELKLKSGTEKALTHYYHDLDKKENLFQLLDPKRLLQRGYAMISSGEEILSSVERIKSADNITIWMADGKLNATVNKIEKYE